MTSPPILDPFGNATHTALAFNMVGEDVLITGAGPIGIMATAVARYAGARHVVITDVNDYRLELARKMGASRAINVQRESLDQTMKDLGMQEGFDVGLEMSGNPAAFREMLRTMHHGGSIAILGIPPEETAIDWNQVIFKGLTLKGIYGREMFETWYKMASLLQSGLKLDPIITHHFPVQEFLQGLRDHGLGQVGQGNTRLVDAVAGRALLRFAEAVSVQAVGNGKARQALRLARHRVEPLRELRQRGLPGGADAQQAAQLRAQLQRELLRPGELRLDEFGRVVGELGAPRRGLHRVVERAELIDQPEAARIAPRPHVALGDGVDLLAGLAAAAGDALEKLFVAARDLRLQQRARLLAQWTVDAQLPGQRRGADPVHADAELAERADRSSG